NGRLRFCKEPKVPVTSRHVTTASVLEWGWGVCVCVCVQGGGWVCVCVCVCAGIPLGSVHISLFVTFAPEMVGMLLLIDSPLLHSPLLSPPLSSSPDRQ